MFRTLNQDNDHALLSQLYFFVPRFIAKRYPIGFKWNREHKWFYEGDLVETYMRANNVKIEMTMDALQINVFFPRIVAKEEIERVNGLIRAIRDGANAISCRLEKISYRRLIASIYKAELSYEGSICRPCIKFTVENLGPSQQGCTF